MTADNPYFKLYDRLAQRFEELKERPNLMRNSVISNCISLNISGSDGGYTTIVQQLFERAKFFFGMDGYCYSFSDWASKHSDEEVLYVVEKAGLLYEERRKNHQGKQSPFQLAIDLLNDLRIKLDFNARGELLVEIPLAVCNDFGLYPPHTGNTKSILISTVVADFCRQSDTYIETKLATEIVLEACKELYPEGYVDNYKSYWSMYNVFDELPYDYDLMVSVIERCREIYQPELDKINGTSSTPDADDTKQLEMPGLYVG